MASPSPLCHNFFFDQEDGGREKGEGEGKVRGRGKGEEEGEIERVAIKIR